MPLVRRNVFLNFLFPFVLLKASSLGVGWPGMNSVGGLAMLSPASASPCPTMCPHAWPAAVLEFSPSVFGPQSFSEHTHVASEMTTEV